MSVAHVDLLEHSLEHAAPRRAVGRLALVLGSAAMLALASVPGVVAVLLLTRPDLFFSN
jgi:hypothetical protein